MRRRGIVADSPVAPGVRLGVSLAMAAVYLVGALYANAEISGGRGSTVLLLLWGAACADGVYRYALAAMTAARVLRYRLKFRRETRGQREFEERQKSGGARPRAMTERRGQDG